MQDGTVLWFNDINGTGRILGDDGTLVSVSHRSLQWDGYRILDEGQRVSFEPARLKSGFEARSVIPEISIRRFEYDSAHHPSQAKAICGTGARSAQSARSSCVCSVCTKQIALNGSNIVPVRMV
jgi:CspA family cold shock protein